MPLDSPLSDARVAEASDIPTRAVNIGRQHIRVAVRPGTKVLRGQILRVALKRVDARCV